MIRYIGIDPGATGGVAVLDPHGRILDLRRFDDLCPVAVLLEVFSGLDGKAAVTALELVHAAPGQGVVSMFSFGVSYGKIQGFLATLGLPYFTVSPQTWQKRLPPAEAAKDRIRLKAVEVWGLERFIFARCRVPHSGCLDAAGIAYYARAVHLGKEVLPKPQTKTKRRMLKL